MDVHVGDSDGGVRWREREQQWLAVVTDPCGCSVGVRAVYPTGPVVRGAVAHVPANCEGISLVEVIARDAAEEVSETISAPTRPTIAGGNDASDVAHPSEMVSGRLHVQQFLACGIAGVVAWRW
jgi:hypothetical protein